MTSTIILYIKGAEKFGKKFVCASNQNGLLGGLLQSEWFLLQLCSSWVVHRAEQFLFIVLEFQEYYKEKCTSHTATPGEQFVFIVLEIQPYYNKNLSRGQYYYSHYYSTHYRLLLVYTNNGHKQYMCTYNS